MPALVENHHQRPDRLFVGLLIGLLAGTGTPAAAQESPVHFGGLAQVRYTSSLPTSGDVTHDFGVPLVDLVANGTTGDPRFSFLASVEASALGDSESIHLLDAWVQYQASPFVQVRVGKFLVPFSRQFYTSPGMQLMPVGAVADAAFALPRSSGVQAVATMGDVTLDLAAVRPMAPLSAASDDHGGGSVSAVARVTWDVLDAYGYQESSVGRVAMPQLTLGVAAAQNEARGSSALQNVNDGVTARSLTADAGLRWGPVSLQTALYMRAGDSVGFGNLEAIDRGHYAQLGVQLVPLRWEVSSRFADQSFRAPLLEGSPAKQSEYSVGFNRYLDGHGAKVQAQYRVVRSRSNGPSSQWEHSVVLQTQVAF